MAVQKFQKEIDYFYDSIKSNRNPIVADRAIDVNTKDSKSLKQIAVETPTELDKSKVDEIINYLINNEYIILNESSTHYMLFGVTSEDIKRDLEKKFVK